MRFNVGKRMKAAKAIPVERWVTARTYAPVREDPVLLRLTLTDGRTVAVDMSPAEAARVGAELVEHAARGERCEAPARPAARVLHLRSIPLEEHGRYEKP